MVRAMYFSASALSHLVFSCVQDRDRLREAMKQGKMLAKAMKDGVDLSTLPPPKASSVPDDRTPCPHCGRKFNDTAARRHIPLVGASLPLHARMLTLPAVRQEVQGEAQRPHSQALGSRAVEGGWTEAAVECIIHPSVERPCEGCAELFATQSRVYTKAQIVLQ